MTTTTATDTAAPPRKKGRLLKVLAVLAVAVGAAFLADAIIGVDAKSFHAPTVDELFEFKPIFTVAGIEVTFPTLVMFGVTTLLIVFFVGAFRRPKMIPSGPQNVAEAGVDFIREGIAVSVIGPEGHAWVPFLTAMFFWILFNNLMSIIPVIQFPVTSRMAYPATLAALVWIIYNAVGIKEQGFFKYFKNIMFPPGVPKPIYLLLSPIEFVSTILVRPFSLAVRLFANMLAGHLILVSFAVLATALWDATYIGAVAPGAMLVALTGFEILVAFLQAYIFTILTAVFIGGALHPDH